MSEKDDEAILESLSDGEVCDGELLNDGDTWIEELECALLADCDPATLKKIIDGRRIPANLRPDYWRILLALNDAGIVKLTREYDLENQDEIRNGCEKLVEDIANNLAKEPLSEADRSRLLSDFESTITTYVKARPELSYVHDNGWTDILKVLYHLQLNDSQLYQMFFRIVDRYIPKELSHKQISDEEAVGQVESSEIAGQATTQDGKQTKEGNKSRLSSSKTISHTIGPIQGQHRDARSMNKVPSSNQIENIPDKGKSTQAYHLLRLLIQYHDPELCSILDSRRATPNLYVKDWFCTLFARSCSPNLALLIWDTHFRMADPFLIFFAAIVMVVNAGDELKKKNLNQAEMLSLLKAMPDKLEEDDIEDLYYLVSNHYTNSTPRSIRSYSHLFFMDTFGNTYSGNDSPEDGRPLTDVKTSRLTSSLDLSQYLCLPIVPAEIFALDTIHLRSSPTHISALKYFLVDCRPAEQYNAGHLTKAFHLDCSLMLRETSSFATAVQALLEIQRQVVASKSSAGGQHLCFIGSGQEEEDRYVNMVVASFLQKNQKYVSIVVGGFDAVHDYVKTKSELRDSFNKYIVDHNESLCKTCCCKTPEGIERFKARQVETKIASSNASGDGSVSFGHSLFASTSNFLLGDKVGSFTRGITGQQSSANNQSGVSILDKFTTAFVSKSNVIKDRLVGTLNTSTIPSNSLNSGNPANRGHISSHDKLGRRYTGGNIKYSIDDAEDSDLTSAGPGGKLSNLHGRDEESLQEIQIDIWRKQTKLLAFSKCAHIKGTKKYPGYVALSDTHFWILREIPHNKGYASIAAKWPLSMIVQITSKRRQPDLIIFRYGYTNKTKPADISQSVKSDKTCQIDAANSAATTLAAPTTDAPTTYASSKTVIDSDKSDSFTTIVAADQLHIPQAFELIRLVKREVVRYMDNSVASTSELDNNSSSQLPNKPEI